MRWLVALMALLALPLLAGGKKEVPPTMPGPSPIIINDFLKQLGFEITTRKVFGAPNRAEIQRASATHRWSTRIKSTFPSQLGKKSFYRFYVEEEIYPDSLSAQIRLDSLFVMPSTILPEDKKAFPLRRGLRKGSRVIVVGTDVAAYQAKMEQLQDALGLIASKVSEGLPIRQIDSLGTVLKQKN